MISHKEGSFGGVWTGLIIAINGLCFASLSLFGLIHLDEISELLSILLYAFEDFMHENFSDAFS